jgi:hypothetical protein
MLQCFGNFRLAYCYFSITPDDLGVIVGASGFLMVQVLYESILEEEQDDSVV